MVPMTAHQHLQEHMRPAALFTFTHSDLTDVNIIVKEGNLLGILD
jgi:aminoglycoside phosphotransferase (APT) family kinase protein